MTGRPREPAQFGLTGREQVGAAQLVQLQSVLDRPQEPVRRRELGSVLATDIATRRERLERDERRRASQRVVTTTVHELQQLHRELYVAQPTRTELHLALDLDGRQVVEHAAAHRLHVGDEPLALRRRPDERPKGGDVLATEIGVTGDGPGLEQRLELPRLRPPLVVALVARE